jgi:hypothetical protein
MSAVFITINKPATLETAAIDTPIGRGAAARARQRGRLPPGPGLEVTFFAASADWQPAFTGMRMGGYRAEDPALRFEVAVPAALAHSPHAPRYVLAVLEDVLDNARDQFDALQIAFDHAGWQRLVSAAARVETDPPESAWEELPLD